MIGMFRLLGWLEGVSLLLLFFVAMPLKYIWDMPYWVTWIGTAHGLLFILYIIGAVVVGDRLKWKLSILFSAFILSSVPFGTFVFERRYLRDV